MGIIKDVLKPKTVSSRVALGGFALGGANGGSGKFVGEGVNCACVDGVLSTGVGAEVYRMENGDNLPLAANLPAVDSFFYIYEKQEAGGYSKRLGFLSAAGAAYIYEPASDGFALWHAFGARMKAVVAMDGEENPVTLFVGEAGVFAYTVEGAAQTEVGSALPIACVFKDRVFCAVAPFTVRYSAPLQPTDFTESIEGGGTFCFPTENGVIVGLVPFKERIFVLYERGISCLQAAGAARDFRLERVGYHGGKIFGSSAGVCSSGGEKMFFLAEDGLYRFDGAKVERICKNLTVLPLRGGQVCVHAEFEGKYFVVFSDENGEKRAIVVDAESEEGYYAFVPEGVGNVGAQALCSFGGKVQVLSKNGGLPAGAEYLFNAQGLTLGSGGVKTLKALVFEGEGAFSLSVSNSRVEKTFAVALKAGRAKVKLGIKGETFSVKLVLEKGARLRRAEAVTVKLGGSE